MSKPRPVIQYDIEGRKLRTFGSIKEAQGKYGITHISSVCRGKRKQDGGYIWKYVTTQENKHC